jgi:20S proteasome subunit alpha 6
LADETRSLVDGQTLDNVHEASLATSLATTQAADVPETQDPASSLDTSSGSDMTVAEHLAVAPHPEQVDGASSGPFEISGPIDARNELAVSAPPSEEGAFVISPSSSAPAVPDSSVLASSSSSDTSVAAPRTESVAPDEEPPADHTHSPDVPAPSAPEESTASSASLIERSLTQDDPSFGDPRVAGADDLQYDPATQPELHDGPASSDTSTLISGSTTSTYGEPNRLPMKSELQPGVPAPSANRLSISYAAGTKRLVINAEIVEQLKILRSNGRVEITLRVEKVDANELNGIIVSSLP